MGLKRKSKKKKKKKKRKKKKKSKLLIFNFISPGEGPDLTFYAKKVAGYYVIPSEILSVCPSVCPSVSAPTIRLPATPPTPTVLGQSFSNFTGTFRMV